MNTKLFPTLFLMLAAYAFAVDSTSYRFAILGDRTGGNHPGIFEKIVEQAMLLNPKPDFFINVGDLIQGYTPDTSDVRRQWEEATRIMAPLKAQFPFYQVPGNHDLSDPATRSMYETYATKPYYSFDKGPDHFIVLNNVESRNPADLDTAQFAWLKKDLKASKGKRHTFVFFHIPLWSVSTREKQMDALHALFKKSGVDHVFNGHYHNYQQGKRDNITYTIIGSSGGICGNSVPDGTVFHFAVVDVGRTVRIRPILLSGDTMDASWITEKKARIFEDLDTKAFVFKPILFPYGAEPNSGPTVLNITNIFDKTQTFNISWTQDSTCAWRMTPVSIPAFTLAPGAKKSLNFTYTRQKPGYINIPEIRFRLPYGQDTLTRVVYPFFKRELKILKAAKPILVDGNPNESVWTGTRTRPEHWLGNATPDYDSSWVALTYNDSNIYLDPHPDSIIAPTEARFRDGVQLPEDKLRVYFALKNGGDSIYYQIYLSAKGALKDIRFTIESDGTRMDTKWDGVSAYIAHTTNTGFEGEMALPWKALGVNKPVPLLVNFRHASARLNPRGDHWSYQEPWDSKPASFADAPLE